MNLGLDVDNTITRKPEFFRLLSRSVRESGGTVHIISSRTDAAETIAATRAELETLGIEFDALYLLPAAAEARQRCPHRDLDWYGAFIWQKVDYCVRNGVDVYFDDETKVIELFKRYAPTITVFQTF